MHARIVRADIAVGSVQRAVHNAHIRIGNRRLHACLHKRWGCGKDQVAPRRYRAVNQLVIPFTGGKQIKSHGGGRIPGIYHALWF